ncbi:HNH endonuclease signature motif containing protein [Klebsiella pneumoniae]|uniref:HNH endonuclease signature motif containing protein n=1 Tax=Klebsiella pneumoniae TaxID=573 RepID=UPI001C683A7C|nr:HNH endonuclease signature motif containing protein [Klebsiella pneumoniae]
MSKVNHSIAAKPINKEMIETYLHFDGLDFYWKERPLHMCKSEASCISWNKRFAGKKASHTSCKGYQEIRLLGSVYKAHRFVWCMHNGDIPKEMSIDHINHDRSDNRIENLRLVTQAENKRNATVRKDNSSHAVGVHFRRDIRKWTAYIFDGEKKKHLGTFLERKDAESARLNAEKQLGFHPNHGKAKCEAHYDN